jgi:hypothetical protein
MNESENSDIFLKQEKNQLYSNSIEHAIKNLSNPQFLGSIHLKKYLNPKINPVENLIDNELDLKLTKSLKNSFFNPITKTLIILAITFNLFWFLLIYIF